MQGEHLLGKRRSLHPRYFYPQQQQQQQQQQGP
jgi:hypothetical protein